MTTSLVQLSDLHIVAPATLAYGRVDTARSLERAVAGVRRLRQQASAVVITGDLTDRGQAVEYARLRDLLQGLPAPVFLMPGNHDDRSALREAFPEHRYLGDGEFIQYSVAIGELQLVALDTLAPGMSHGELCDRRLGWLDDELGRLGRRPVVLALHHPPFTTLIDHMDQIGLRRGKPELAAIVARHPNVERVICGHLHRAIETRFAGTLASTAPSTAHQVCLDFALDAVPAFAFEPAGFRVHAWSPTAGLISHLVPIGEFVGPFRFHDAM